MSMCKQCIKFKPAINLEVESIDYNSKIVRGICDINNNRRTSEDICMCGGFKRY